MKTVLTLTLALALIAITGCRDESSLTEPDSDALVFDPVLDLDAPPSGGTCPDVYWETEELLEDGVTLTWTSAFGGYEYTIDTDYTALVSWSVDGASATFIEFGARTDRSGNPRKNTWTPRGRDEVDGLLITLDPPVTVNLSDMHYSAEDIDDDGIIDWAGEIGNGHFWLVLDVEGINKPVKLGVNVHLEDPDNSTSRCPTE
ncbi:MAG TPA: hypothetical protein VLC48_09665 [Gemmatimonadota bacterium]|nr:hypothetical protein [Gemmatimonadota bacterium]